MQQEMKNAMNQLKLEPVSYLITNENYKSLETLNEDASITRIMASEGE